MARYKDALFAGLCIVMLGLAACPVSDTGDGPGDRGDSGDGGDDPSAADVIQSDADVPQDDPVTDDVVEDGAPPDVVDERDDLAVDSPTDEGADVSDTDTPLEDVADDFVEESGDGALDGGPDADTGAECVTSLTAAGTVNVVQLETSLDVSGADVEAQIFHRRDVDPVDGGCLARFDVGLSFHESGCSVSMSFRAFADGFGGLVDVTFDADSFCPNFPDADEGLYQLDADPVSTILYLPEWFVGPTSVTERDAASTCLEDITITLPETPLTLVRSDGRRLDLELVDVQLSGELVSQGDTEVSCADTSSCSAGFHDGGDGWCARDGECFWTHGIATGGDCCPLVTLAVDQFDGDGSGLTLLPSEKLAVCFAPVESELPFYLDSLFMLLINGDPGTLASINVNLYRAGGAGTAPAEEEALGGFAYTDASLLVRLGLPATSSLDGPFCVGFEALSGSPGVAVDANGIDFPGDNWLQEVDAAWIQTSEFGDTGLGGDFVIRATGAVCE